MGGFANLEGQRFGRIAVVRELGDELIEVLCDCGVRKTVKKPDVKAGHIKSCGCFRRDRMSRLGRTHGESGTKRTPLYRAWEALWRRTEDAKHYPTYSDNGIGVAKEWLNFEVFREYVAANLGQRPFQGASIDRIDNNRGYEPGNIRWASAKDQARNRRNNTLITANGKTQCIAEWAEETGITSAVICGRRKHGWSDEDAVLTPRGVKRK